MEIKFGATDDGNSNYNPPLLPTSSYSLLPNHAFNVARLTNFRLRNDIMVGGTFDVLSARENEKEKIKDELLIYGNLDSRRELEIEAIKELIAEGKLTVRQPEGVPIINAPMFSLQPGLLGLDELALVNRLCGARFSLANCLEGGIDRRIPFANHGLTDGGPSFRNRQDKIISDGLPFQRQPGVTNEVPCKPIIDLRKAVPLPETATSDALAGSKRKFEASMTNSDDVAAVVSSKKTQRGWSCDLCQVTTNSEQGLKDHLRGKKHKAKEKTVQRTATSTKSVSNISIKSEPPVQALDKSSDLAVGTTSRNISNIVCGNEVTKNVESLSPKNQSNDGFGLEEKVETEEFKKTDRNFKFWCTMCEVGTRDEASMAVHRTGEKHVSLLMEKGGGVITIKTMPDDVDISRNEAAIKEKEVSLRNVDGQKGEVEVNEVETTEKCTMEAH